MNSIAVLLVAVLAVSPAVRAAQSLDHHDHGTRGTSASPGAAGTQALPMADAEVRKIDAKAGKVTLRHGRLENLDMAPMTMVFGVKDPAWLSTLKVGDKVRIAVDRVNGALTVVELQPMQ